MERNLSFTIEELAIVSAWAEFVAARTDSEYWDETRERLRTRLREAVDTDLVESHGT
jgi:pyridoxine/pyridoxamine 5'-phosphate oxidase